MTAHTELLAIGELSRRSGLAPSALRYYESLGLIHAERSGGGQRRYQRSALRRVAVVQAAQRVGLSLEEIRLEIAGLPVERAPSRRDWEALSRRWRARLDARIAALTRVRDDLTSCIGCGCLSLRRCALYNAGDHAAAQGAGPRWLLADDEVPPQGGGDRMGA